MVLECPSYNVSYPNGYPTYLPNLEIYWREANDFFGLGDSEPKNSAILGRNGKLYLRQVTTDGNYVCNINDAVSSVFLRYTINVRVQGNGDVPSPTILSSPADINANNGDTVVMDCISSSP